MCMKGAKTSTWVCWVQVCTTTPGQKLPSSVPFHPNLHFPARQHRYSTTLRKGLGEMGVCQKQAALSSAEDFHLPCNYQARNVFLEAHIRRALSLLLQPDSKAVFMGRFGIDCTCSCRQTGQRERAAACQVTIDQSIKYNLG